MSRYKLIFQDASWQNRTFISLTKIEDDGSARVLNCVDRQISFGTYASSIVERGIEYSHEQTTLMTDMMGSPIAGEKFFTHLIGENILERIFLDKRFLETLVELEKSHNHPVLIEAARDLQQRKCRETIGRIDNTYYPVDYRAYVIRHYINYLLNRDGMRINAHPTGLFTEIHVGDYGVHGGVNDLPVTVEAAVEIREKIEALIGEEYPKYPDYEAFRYLFLGQRVPWQDHGYHLEITDLTDKQIQVVDSLFNLAAEKGFFPTDPEGMIRKAWEANCRKMSESALSLWGVSSSALLSATASAPAQDDRMQIVADEQALISKLK